ncbi:hypothetical protein [Cellulomonas sp. GbtcB1]|uniref:hypothetical protein n=1 Tax=Cellulomonas sp. GbtcB1 TaxID=2824746 RepID=UPI001C2FB93B|nr:hypothetical protein [Cellulomonas sp. GbtcB1]
MTGVRFRKAATPHGELQGWSSEDPGGVLLWDAPLYRTVTSWLERVFRAHLAAARAIWEPAPAQFARTLGLGEQLAAEVPVEWDDDSVGFCRVDFVLEAGRPTVLEMNVGTSAGGSIDVEAWARRVGPSIGARPHHARLRWVARRASELGACRVVIPVWPWLATGDPERYFASTRHHLGELGFSSDLVPLLEVPHCVDRERDVALRLFAVQDALAHGLAPRDYGYGRESQVRWLCGEFATALSSKALLAATALQRSDAPLVPQTRVLGNAPPGLEGIPVEDAVALRDDLVLKPVDELGGTGVAIGRTTAPDVWASLCRGARPGGWVVQRVATPDVVHTPRGPAAAVWGAYLVEGRASGMLARFLPGGRGDCVINGHTGALLTAAVAR